MKKHLRQLVFHSLLNVIEYKDSNIIFSLWQVLANVNIMVLELKGTFALPIPKTLWVSVELLFKGKKKSDLKMWISHQSPYHKRIIQICLSPGKKIKKGIIMEHW